MAYKIHYHGEYFLITTSGEAEAATFKDAIEEVCSHRNWRDCHSYIMDHTDLKVLELENVDIRNIAKQSKKLRLQHGVKKTAVVAPTNVSFGISRMWETLAEDETDVQISIFKTRAQAVEWICS